MYSFVKAYAFNHSLITIVNFNAEKRKSRRFGKLTCFEYLKKNEKDVELKKIIVDSVR